MLFAIIHDNQRDENAPTAFWDETLEGLTTQVCAVLQQQYKMPSEISTLENAAAWFSGVDDEADDIREDADPYDNVYWWNTSSEKSGQ